MKLANLLVPLAALALIVAWLSISPPGILGKADALGYAVCHRLDERSFHLDDGQQSPLCARCSGMYLGATLGIVFQLFTAKRRAGLPHWTVWLLFGFFAAAFAVDGANSYFYLMKSVAPGRLEWIPTLYLPNNTLRLFTGTGVGLAMAAGIFPSFNQTAWRTWDDSPALTWRTLPGLLALALGMILLVLPEWDWVLYPAYIISAAGILLLLTMVYAMVWLMLMRQENTIESWSQLGIPLLAGLTVALLQITAIDIFRLWLTGTWGGFPLG
jgi:uncharacterized membrane protein